MKRLQDQQLKREDALMVGWIITVDILYCVLTEVVVLKTHLSLARKLAHEIGQDVTAASFMFCVREQNGFLAVLNMYFLSLVARMIRHQGHGGILKQTIVSDLNKTGLHEKTAYFALYYTISQITV